MAQGDYYVVDLPLALTDVSLTYSGMEPSDHARTQLMD